MRNSAFSESGREGDFPEIIFFCDGWIKKWSEMWSRKQKNSFYTLHLFLDRRRYDNDYDEKPIGWLLPMLHQNFDFLLKISGSWIFTKFWEMIGNVFGLKIDHFFFKFRPKNASRWENMDFWALSGGWIGIEPLNMSPFRNYTPLTPPTDFSLDGTWVQ